MKTIDINKESLKYWEDNCREELINTPISVLRYIGELEKAIKNSYSRKQVESLLHLALATGSAYGDDMDSENAESWVKENLK